MKILVIQQIKNVLLVVQLFLFADECSSSSICTKCDSTKFL